MRKSLKIAVLAAGALLVMGGASLVSIYQASQHVPEFYREALALDPQDLAPARDEFVAQVTALASDLHRAGRWQSLFTAEQINAWLALELATSYPDMMQQGLYDPRIAIRADEATIACRYENGQMSAVLSLTVDAYLQEPNVLALRIRRARAGALPVPLTQVLDGISHAARELNLRIEWRKTHGDPVALITFPRPRSSESESLHLQAIELRDGELFASGTIGTPPSIVGPARTDPGHQASAPDVSRPAAQRAVGAAEKETRQK